MIFKYRAVSQNGDIIEGKHQADDEKEVLDMLKSNKYLPIEIKRSLKSNKIKNKFILKLKKKELAVFCRQFHTMLNAGIGIVQCIGVLENQAGNKILKNTLSDIHGEVQKGQTLSQSMACHEQVFPLLLINMVEVGEVSGNLDKTMERMAIHFEKETKINNKIKSATIYPLILVVVSLVVVVFLLTIVMPIFIGIFESNGQTLPTPTRILLVASNLFIQYWYIFIFVAIIFTIGVFYYKNTVEGRRIFDNLKIKIPIVKGMNKIIIASRFTRILSILIASGVPLLKSVEIVAKVLENSIIEEKMVKTLGDIRRGVTLSRAVGGMNLFPPMVESMIKIGEESGNLDGILNKSADFYDEEVSTMIQQMTTLLEPVMIIFMTIVIGFIVLTIAMPMFDMLDIVQ